MKKPIYWILGGLAVIGMFWYLKKGKISASAPKAGDNVRATYTGMSLILGTNDWLNTGETITGTLQSDGSVRKMYITSYGIHSINIASKDLVDVISVGKNLPEYVDLESKIPVTINI